MYCFFKGMKCGPSTEGVQKQGAAEYTVSGIEEKEKDKTERQRELNTEEHRKCHPSPNITKTIKSRRTRKQLIWYGHVERMDPTRLPKIMIPWKPEGRKKNEAVPREPGKMEYIQT